MGVVHRHLSEKRMMWDNGDYGDSGNKPTKPEIWKAGNKPLRESVLYLKNGKCSTICQVEQRSLLLKRVFATLF